MIGNDCRLMELNIDKFLSFFLRVDKGESINGDEFTKMRHVSILYNKFKDIARLVS